MTPLQRVTPMWIGTPVCGRFGHFLRQRLCSKSSVMSGHSRAEDNAHSAGPP